MTTVTITGNTIRGATTSKDNRTWQIRAVAYQYGGTGGGVITPGADWETLYPVDGVLTFTAEAGSVAEIKTPDEVPYRVRIPTSNAGLWDVIEAGVAYQPDVAQDTLNRAVANAAPGFIAAELELQTADAITADLAARRITFSDLGGGEGYFSVGGVPVSGTLVPPAATWSGVAARPSYAADSVARNGETDDRGALAADDDAALALDGGLPLMLRSGVHRVASNLTIDSPMWFLPGAIIKPDSGVTVTLAGGIVNAPVSQIFDASAGGVVVPEMVNYLPPQWWGAAGDGVADDTLAIEAAWEATSGTLFFPRGTYLYNGTGLTGAEGGDSPRITGAGMTETTITLGASSYLLNYSTKINSIHLADLTVDAGLGAVKQTFTGENVTFHHEFHRVYFHHYTEAAVALDAVDMPYVMFSDCIFRGANYTSCIGIALGGYTDQSVIERCSFWTNRVHIKARRGGNNLHIKNCDLIFFGATNSAGPRAAIWVVPETVSVNSGVGMLVTGCKFGNEGLVAGDYRILYADEGAGATNGVKLPNTAADSTGFITGHTFTGNSFIEISAGSNSLIYTTTPNVVAVSLGGNQHYGTPKYAIEYRTPSVLPDRMTSQNWLGPFHWVGNPDYTMPISNAIGVAYLNDPDGSVPNSSHIKPITGGTSSSFSQLLTQAMPDWWPGGTCTQEEVTDGFGGTDAATLTWTAGYGLTNAAVGAMSPGVPVWVEIDVKNPGAEALEQFQFYIQDGGTSTFHWRRMIPVPSVEEGWVTYSFHFTPRSDTSPYVIISNHNNQAGKVTVGRPRVYHSMERVLGGRRPTVTGDRSTTAATTSLLTQLAGQGLITDSTTPGTATVITGDRTTGAALEHLLTALDAKGVIDDNSTLGASVVTMATTPTTPGSAGTPGQISWDTNYFYICTPDGWRRTAIGWNES